MGQDTIDKDPIDYIVMWYEIVEAIERWWMSCLVCGYQSAHVTADQFDELTAWTVGHRCVVA